MGQGGGKSRRLQFVGQRFFRNRDLFVEVLQRLGQFNSAFLVRSVTGRVLASAHAASSAAATKTTTWSVCSATASAATGAAAAAAASAILALLFLALFFFALLVILGIVLERSPDSVKVFFDALGVNGTAREILLHPTNFIVKLSLLGVLAAGTCFGVLGEEERWREIGALGGIEIGLQQLTLRRFVGEVVEGSVAQSRVRSLGDLWPK